jgi:hypothetical protein
MDAVGGVQRGLLRFWISRMVRWTSMAPPPSDRDRAIPSSHIFCR